jgi:hypothetical protein
MSRLALVSDSMRVMADACRRWWRLLRWHGGQRLGWPGAIGAAALVGAWTLAGVLAERAEHGARLASPSLAAQAASIDAAQTTPDPRDAWLAAMPDTRQRAKHTARLIGAAEGSGLLIGATDYSLEVSTPGLARLRVTLPVSGSYAQIRRHIGQVLGQSPYTGLDGLQIERPTGERAGLQATVRWSLYFREPAP